MGDLDAMKFTKQEKWIAHKRGWTDGAKASAIDSTMGGLHKHYMLGYRRGYTARRNGLAAGSRTFRLTVSPLRYDVEAHGQ